MHVTIVPREKFPLGQTVLKVNEQRELTYQFTRRYLQEQLLTVLAGAQTFALTLVASASTELVSGDSCLPPLLVPQTTSYVRD